MKLLFSLTILLLIFTALISAQSPNHEWRPTGDILEPCQRLGAAQCGTPMEKRVLACWEKGAVGGSPVFNETCAGIPFPDSQWVPCTGQNFTCGSYGTCSPNYECICNSGYNFNGNACVNQYRWVLDAEWSACGTFRQQTCGQPVRYKDHRCYKYEYNIVDKREVATLVDNSFCTQYPNNPSIQQCTDEPQITCLNSANCVLVYPSTSNTWEAKCACSTEWSGPRCETSTTFKWNVTLTNCDWQYPSNGKCGVKVATPVATCIKEGTTDVVADSWCITSVGPKPTDKVPCSDEIQCTRGDCYFNRCSCPTGYTGDLCENEVSDAWTWKATNWSACGKQNSAQKCGLQHKTRTVTCTNKFGVADDESKCDQTTKPAAISTEDCPAVTELTCGQGECSTDLKSCACPTGWSGANCEIDNSEAVVWKAGPWGKCKPSMSYHVCGRQIRERTIACHLQRTDEQLPFSDARCVAAEPEAPTDIDFTTCPLLPGGGCKNGGVCRVNGDLYGTGTCRCPDFYDGDRCEDYVPEDAARWWQYGPWGPCQLEYNDECEPYYRTRNVTCVNASGEPSSGCGGSRLVQEHCHIWNTCNGIDSPFVGPDLKVTDPYASDNNAVAMTTTYAFILIIAIIAFVGY